MSSKILTEIWIYPIKSFPGIRVRSATVSGKGLVGDRRFMLVDADNVSITQRDCPNMALFELMFDHQMLRIRPKNQERQSTLQIDLGIKELHPLKAKVWDDEVDVLEVSPTYSKWFSDALQVNCKFVFFPENNTRQIDPEFVPNMHNVSLADAYPFLIIGNSSLQDLNQKVGFDLSMRRFRPNFIFDGGEPFEEDGWKNFTINDITFKGVKPCGRCVLTTIDPETAMRGDEPLRTLSTYRNKNGKVYFGQNMISLNEGTVNEGNEIHIS